MQITAIILSILVFTAGVVFGQSNKDDFSQDAQQSSESNVSDERILGAEDPTVKDQEGLINLSSTPVPSIPSELSSYIYPGAELLSSTDKEVTLRSNADISEIVEWYKNQINTSHQGIKNFIVTKTNGTETDKLTFTEENKQITIEISSTAEDVWTNMSVKSQ